MADFAMSCALRTSQCYQDKNRVRKELNRWTKNLLLLVGLERVAQELMGGKRWSKLSAPLNNLEPDEVQDWNNQEACFFCSSDKHDANQAAVVKHSEDCIHYISSDPSSFNELPCSCGVVSSSSAISGFSPLNNDACAGINGANNSLPDRTLTTVTSSLTEQPLDLSLHSRCKLPTDDSEQPELTTNGTPLLRVPQPITAKSSKKTRPETTSNWKRTYTEKELQAALNDIQSGKLGTRRAAVIYGIPRSTLRNKVYKLCSDRKKGTSPVSASNTKASTLASTNKANPDSSANDRNALCNISRSPSLISSKNIDNVDNKVAIELLNNCKSSNLKDKSDVDNIATSMNNFSIAREAILEVLKKAINQRGSKSYYPQPTHMVNSSNDTNVQKGNKEASDLTNSMNMLIDPLATNQILPTLDRGNTIGPLLYQILLNVHNLPWLSPSPTDATVNNNNNNYNNYNNSELDKRISNTLPLLHELIPKLVQERLKAETNQSTNDATRDSTTPSIGSNIASDGYCDNSNFILKVPSFQPKSSPEASSVPSLVSPVCPTSNKMTPALSSAVNTNNISTPASSYSSAKLLSSDIPSSYSTHGDRKDIVNLMNDSNMSDSNTCISSHSHGDRRDNFTTMLKDENHVIGKSSNSGNKSLNCISTILSVHSDESSSDALMNENKDSSSTQRHKKVDKRNLATLSTASDQSAPSTPDPKRNRPKRGRYRNYKRDDLARAVRAVQMGEMSVHRAGTHFGVPHSTLEYKVKERHLLRPKKRQTNASSSSSSSLIKKDDNNNNRSLLIQPKNTLTESTTQSSGALNQANNISNFSLWQAALPLLPFDIGSTQNSSNYFASNIMRKLKENARLNQEISNITNLSNSNSTSAIANSLNNSTGENNINSNSLGTNISNINNDNNNNNNSKEYGSFLLESLIKSSLEKRNSNHSSRDSDEESDKEGAKFNSSLAALKKVTSLDAIKE